jgi:hypothetical protein
VVTDLRLVNGHDWHTAGRFVEVVLTQSWRLAPA